MIQRWLVVAAVGLLAVATITGIALLFGYQPDAPRESVLAIEERWGWLRRLHHASSGGLLVALLALLVARFWHKEFGAAWLAGLVCLGLALSFQLTGHALPWDAHAESTTATEIGIVSEMPVVGGLKARFLQGGEEFGDHTVKVWHRFHAVWLPLISVLFLAYLARRAKPNLDWQGAGVAILLLALFAVKPLSIGDSLADSPGYYAQPEWYVLPLHALYRLTGGGMIYWLAILGCLAFLVALPAFAHRINRVAWSLVALAVLGSMSAICIWAIQPAPRQSKDPPAVLTKDASLAEQGQRLYAQHRCSRCHAIEGQGSRRGPNLTKVGEKRPDRDWHVRHLQNPSQVSPGSTMPSFRRLPESELRALAEYLVNLR